MIKYLWHVLITHIVATAAIPIQESTNHTELRNDAESISRRNISLQTKIKAQMDDMGSLRVSVGILVNLSLLLTVVQFTKHNLTCSNHMIS